MPFTPFLPSEQIPVSSLLMMKFLVTGSMVIVAASPLSPLSPLMVPMVLVVLSLQVIVIPSPFFTTLVTNLPSPTFACKSLIEALIPVNSLLI